jgi:hypothetical protein
VYLLSAQFPGPTTPRDFVTMFLTSDQALTDNTGDGEVPRHFMVISKPCIHPDTEPREGFIRGQYESVEFIREISIKKVPKRSGSTSNLLEVAQSSPRRERSSTLGKEAILRSAARTHSQLLESDFDTPGKFTESETNPSPKGEASGRARGKTISFDTSRSNEVKESVLEAPGMDDDCETNPIEWIMITRSDPGGSVPRFMVERGTPGGIVADASKFLNWACAKDIEDFESDEEVEPGADDNESSHAHHHNLEQDLHNYQTNGHLAGLEEESGSAAASPVHEVAEQPATNDENGGYYGMVTGVVGAVSTIIASHTPAMVSDHLPGLTNPESEIHTNTSIPHRESISSISTESTALSFASALEDSQAFEDNISTKTSESNLDSSILPSIQGKELQKLESKKRKLEGKHAKVREKESSKSSTDKEKEEEAMRKVEERHQREVKKREEKHAREVSKLALKKEKERKKAEERKKKAEDKDEKVRMGRELEELRAEVDVLRKEREIIRGQVGELQKENTSLAARVGRLGLQGEEVLREVREEVQRGARLRASSLKGIARTGSFRSGGSGKSSESGEHLVVPAS